jgi:hypothetical protein
MVLNTTPCHPQVTHSGSVNLVITGLPKDLWGWGTAQPEDPGLQDAGSRGLVKVCWKLPCGPSLGKGLLSELHSGIGHERSRHCLYSSTDPNSL